MCEGDLLPRLVLLPVIWKLLKEKWHLNLLGKVFLESRGWPLPCYSC